MTLALAQSCMHNCYAILISHMTCWLERKTNFAKTRCRSIVIGFRPNYFFWMGIFATWHNIVLMTNGIFQTIILWSMFHAVLVFVAFMPNIGTEEGVLYPTPRHGTNIHSYFSCLISFYFENSKFAMLWPSFLWYPWLLFYEWTSGFFQFCYSKVNFRIFSKHVRIFEW